MMTNAKHMLWMLDEYETISGARYPGFITGKPVGMGGSLGRTEATGYGVVYVLREALKELGIDITKTTASFQGFGNVSQHAVKLYRQLGGKAVAVSCWDNNDNRSYTFKKQDGIDPDALKRITDSFGSIDKDKAGELGYEILPGEAGRTGRTSVPATLKTRLRRCADKMRQGEGPRGRKRSRHS